MGKGILSDYSEENKTEWGKVEISAIVPHEYIHDEDRYAILVCRACNEFFVAKGERYSDPDSPNYWSAVYPIQHKTAPQEIPEPIRSEFEEASLCFAIGAYKACVLTCQIALEHVWHEQHVSGLAEIKDRYRNNSILLEFEGELGEIEGVTRQQDSHEYVELFLDRETPPQKVLEQLVGKGVRVTRFEVSTPSLNDIFLQIVDKGQ